MSTPILQEDAHTVSHLWVSGGVLIDTKGNTWTLHGSVPYNAAASLGFAIGKSAESVGPFSDANYFTLGAGADVLDFAGNFTATFIVSGLPAGTAFFFANGGSLGNNKGGYALGASSSAWDMRINEATNPNYPQSITNSTTPHLVTLGSGAGGSGFLKVDTGTVLSVPGWSPTAAATIIAALGRTTETTGKSWPGKVFEGHITTSAASVAALDAIHNSLLDANYANIVNTAQQNGADSVIRPARFFGLFHMH